MLRENSRDSKLLSRLFIFVRKEGASMEHNCPFSAIVGQEQMKLALLLNPSDPALGGVLLCGEKGTAKSTMVRNRRI